MSGPDKEVLVFSKDFSRYSYGADHPLRIERFQLTMDLIGAYGLFDNSDAPWMEAKMAEEHDLLLFHTQKYLEILKRADSGQTSPKAWTYGLGSGDNPVFPGLYEWFLLVTGATLDCIRQILDENMQIAFNIAGGLHHAMSSRASGFCYINDPTVGIARMIQDSLRFTPGVCFNILIVMHKLSVMLR